MSGNNFYKCGGIKMTTEQIINHIESEINLNSNVYPETSLTGFSEACYNQNSEYELAEAIIFYDQNETGDVDDMKIWDLKAEEWKNQIELALAEKIRGRIND